MRNQQATQLLFELSKPGRRATRFPRCDVPAGSASDLFPSEYLADEPPPLPELAEPDVVRHYTNLSTLNMSVDTHFYPLGSCTMKYRISLKIRFRVCSNSFTRCKRCWRRSLGFREFHYSLPPALTVN